MANRSHPLATQVLLQLQANKSLNPTQNWLNTFLSTQRSGLPPNTLVQTASFRLLNSDIKDCLEASASATFPPSVVNANVKESRIKGPIIVQVLDIEDMSRSRWSQIEELEAEERGEMTKGREIIRIAPSNGDDQETSNEGSSRGSAGPHKLLVEDSRGTKIFAIELTKVAGINLAMEIGTKILLKDVVVARGVILLEASPKTAVLGGKLEPLHTNWRAARKEQLRKAIGSETV